MLTKSFCAVPFVHRGSSHRTVRVGNLDAFYQNTFMEHCAPSLWYYISKLDNVSQLIAEKRYVKFSLNIKFWKFNQNMNVCLNEWVAQKNENFKNSSNAGEDGEGVETVSMDGHAGSEVTHTVEVGNVFLAFLRRTFLKLGNAKYPKCAAEGSFWDKLTYINVAIWWLNVNFFLSSAHTEFIDLPFDEVWEKLWCRSTEVQSRSKWSGQPNKFKFKY